jgi:hypothetical protein
VRGWHEPPRQDVVHQGPRRARAVQYDMIGRAPAGRSRSSPSTTGRVDERREVRVGDEPAPGC